MIRSSSTSTSSTAPRVPTSTSLVSRVSPPRPATPRSCCTRCSTRACSDANATNTKGLIFNVKGEDLLFLDHANTRLDDEQRARYAPLGLQPGPFRSVRISCAASRGDPNATPATGARIEGVSPLFWTIAEFCEHGLLPFLFADAEDERQQYTIVVHSVTARLRECAQTATRATAPCASKATTVRDVRRRWSKSSSRS